MMIGWQSRNRWRILEEEYPRACLPERFSGKDTDLVVAEAAFDVLTNTAAPSARGIGLDED